MKIIKIGNREVQTYTKKEVTAIVKALDKTPVKTKDGITYCTVGNAFCLSRGKYLVLKDTAKTDNSTMKTTIEMVFCGLIVSGETQEECYRKIISALLKEVAHDKNK